MNLVGPFVELRNRVKLDDLAEFASENLEESCGSR